MATKQAGGLIVFRRAIDLASKKEIPEFLLVKAAYGDHHWSFPKGHTDPGETNEQAAWRETEEEVGLKKEHLKEIKEFKKTLTYPVRKHTKIVDLWLAELIDPSTSVKIDPSEVEAFEWTTLGNASRPGLYESTEGALAEADKFVREHYFGK